MCVHSYVYMCMSFFFGTHPDKILILAQIWVWTWATTLEHLVSEMFFPQTHFIGPHARCLPICVYVLFFLEYCLTSFGESVRFEARSVKEPLAHPSCSMTNHFQTSFSTTKLETERMIIFLCKFLRKSGMIKLGFVIKLSDLNFTYFHSNGNWCIRRLIYRVWFNTYILDDLITYLFFFF